ncbi:sulfotransferase [Sphingosinicella sp. CPCC 101087]|uniref:sulfotransferase family protein n=1 Tax=Sphingosinicella sp. CPCC 101087 TaxID=2497754 RepID=UPI0013E9D60F|nr:sulfotransferase [Sphingosinicella sp. CPCC 101087]
MLPNLIVIGAMKAGTTSLHQYLSLHPEICMSDPKETDFFVETGNWQRGLAWYQSSFARPAAIWGDASPNYTAYPHLKGVPERMHSVVPDAKLIYVVRDPIARMVSNYLHNVHGGREERPIAEALLDPSSRYLNRSRYYLQVRQFLDYYDQSRIMIVSSEELSADRVKVLREVFAFLGVDDTFRSDEFHGVSGASAEHKRQLTLMGRLSRGLARAVEPIMPSRNEAWSELKQSARLLLSRERARPMLKDDARERIADLLAEDVAQFRSWSRVDFNNWSI